MMPIFRAKTPCPMPTGVRANRVAAGGEWRRWLLAGLQVGLLARCEAAASSPFEPEAESASPLEPAASQELCAADGRPILFLARDVSEEAQVAVFTASSDGSDAGRIARGDIHETAIWA